MQENRTLLEIDLRLTECGQESEYIINQILKKNQDIDRSIRIEDKNQVYRRMQRTYSHIF